MLAATPLDTAHYDYRAGRTPVTYVLSDPNYDNGHGERSFINDIGAGWEYRPEELPREFYEAEIAQFGGTALVPRIHDGLTQLLHRAKEHGAITVVNTVYDFRNEQAAPGRRWPLGSGDESYALVDLLLCDREEALRLSGARSVSEALERFAELGTGAAVVTQGAGDTVAYAQSSAFKPLSVSSFPISARVRTELASARSPEGDTTGCGDNFTGGVVASLGAQMSRGESLDLADAIALGTVSGGFTCFHMGETFPESEPGEKWRRLEPYYRTYCREQL